MTAYRLTPTVEKLPSTVPFVGPEAQERSRGRSFRARIGANESVFGPSPRAVQAMQDAAVEAWKYCDPENHDLKQALARHHGVAADNVVVGEGIDGLFGYAVRLFVEPGVTVATSLGAARPLHPRQRRNRFRSRGLRRGAAGGPARGGLVRTTMPH